MSHYAVLEVFAGTTRYNPPALLKLVTVFSYFRKFIGSLKSREKNSQEKECERELVWEQRMEEPGETRKEKT